ncbi:TetR/AcrR family transcriptional regulator [Robertmurraya sp. FSL W8-0741]|uniref:TetR/AcrR family transcriptional regulator n=1 Tax=Robertmurraya TaxID=2837507 RepID=UPI0010F8318F|nr:TetR/AcrR family transcriptional regulator [Robertmurraya siralis]
MRNRIINETISLIQEKGFSFTVSELAANLGTSKRTIYQHFSSKDQIVEEVIETFIHRIKQNEQEIALNENLNVLAKLKLILCSTPEEFEFMNIRLLSDLKKNHFQQWEKLDHFLREEWSTVLTLMKQGIEQGFIRNINLNIFIELYLGAINQIYKSPMALQDTLTIKEKLEAVMDILLHGISKSEDDN